MRPRYWRLARPEHSHHHLQSVNQQRDYRAYNFTDGGFFVGQRRTASGLHELQPGGRLPNWRARETARFGWRRPHREKALFNMTAELPRMLAAGEPRW